MLEFFGVDISKEQSTGFDGEKFLTRTVNEPLKGELEACERESKIIKSKATPSVLSTVLVYLFPIIAVIGLYIVGINIDDNGLYTAYRNYNWLFFVTGASIIVWLILFIMRAAKRRTALYGERKRLNDELTEKLIKKLREELSIPDTALNIDIMSYEYRPIEKQNALTDMIAATNCFIHMGNEFLSIFDFGGRYDIPLQYIKQLRPVRSEKTFINGWNKTEPPTSEQYKKYKVVLERDGAVTISGYVEMLVEEPDGTAYRVMFPNYEDELLRFLGLR